MMLTLPEEILSKIWRFLSKKVDLVLSYDVIEKTTWFETTFASSPESSIVYNGPCDHEACTVEDDDPYNPSIVREAEETFFDQLKLSSQALRCSQRL